MAAKSLTREQMQEAIDALASHGNVTEAALAMGIARATLQNRLGRAYQAGLRPPEVESTTRLPQTADECWAFLDAAIGRTAKKLAPPKAKAKGTKRIVIAGDLHAPFHDVEAVGQMLHETEGFDQIIVNGDLQDHYSVSRFVKTEHVAIEREIAAVDGLLGTFSRAYPDVFVVEGNHDRPRFEKSIRALLSLEMMAVIEYLTGGNLSIIRAIGKRYPNVRFADVKIGRHHVGWFAQEGDLLVAHAEKYSRVPGAALRGIDEWFSDQHDVLGLRPWKVLVQAHTHQLGMFPWKADRLLVEGGCLCSTAGYMLDPRVAGRTQRVGYVTLTQRDGVTDISSVRMHWLEPGRKVA